MLSASRRGLGCALVVLAVTPACHGVIFKFTDDPGYNTNAPTGALTDSGWQWQGTWLNVLGTPIAPTFFVTAKHVGGSIGEIFTLDGFGYHTVTNYPDPSSDLQIWQVAETFPNYAPLFTNTTEVGKACVVFGRGTQRGVPVIIDGDTNGWRWGTADLVQRWGDNEVTGTIQSGGLLRTEFNRNAGSNECHLSTGDSGGALFIQDGGEWKLAGIHLAVDGPFSNAVDGTTFDAALLDRGGLCEVGGPCFPNLPPDNPSAFYSTRISARLAWIQSVIHFQPGNDLGITGIEPIGNDMQISFLTANNRAYRLQRRSALPAGEWTTFTNGVAGTGGIVSVLDTGGAGVSNQFYRVGFSTLEN